VKAVVTGGAGFIGSELVHQLAERGDEIEILDTLVSGKRENVDDVLGERVRLHEIDIRDDAAVRAIIEGADVVFHLACRGVRHSLHAPRDNHDVNATGTLQLLVHARDAGVSRFVHVSSSEVYGTARWAPMTEEHPTFPHTVYGASKLAGECYARAFHDTYGYPVVIVRPFNAYGLRGHHEGDSGEVIPKFMLRSIARKPMVIFGDGTQTRDFTHVSDTARAILALAGSDAAVGATVNVGSGRELSINELAEIIAGVTGAGAGVIHDAPRPGDVHRLIADTSKLEALCGFRPRVSFETGLAELHGWYSAAAISAEELLAADRVRSWEKD
jgi:UDP-glucose 4-epimerase